MTDITRERCRICDAPTVTEAELAELLALPDPPDNWRPDLCWTSRLGISGDCEGRKPVDWRSRCLAAESALGASREKTIRDFYAWLNARCTWNLPTPKTLDLWLAAWIRGEP